MKHLLPAALFILLPSAFCLSQQQAPWSGADTWAFLPGEDPYTDAALFDLRPLLDKVAGEKGWIRHDENGDFVRGDGSPIRFWASNGSRFEGDAAKMEKHARHITKRGVNLVRIGHRYISDSPTNPVPDDKLVRELQMAAATLKRHGAYSHIGIYWNSDAELFWNKERQAAYKNWWRELLTRPNPFCPNNTPLKDDPAVAILEIQNEASWLWWNSQGWHNDPKRKDDADRLNALFKAWLAENKLPDADIDFRLWDINRGDPTHSTEPRESLKLTMRFAAETMRAFNVEIQRFLRDDIGCPALVMANNWQTADQVRLLDLERWSYDANDVIGLNRYVELTGHHNTQGRGGWLIEPGDTYRNISTLRGDGWRNLPTNAKQIKGKPFMVSETGWVAPNLFQAEAPFLTAAYMSLTGVDGCYWSGILTEGYDVSASQWTPGMFKWNNHASPEVMGGFPATVWMYHKGYLKRGAVVVDEKRGLAGDLWELRVPVISEDTGFDPNQPGTKRAQSNIVGGVHPAAYLMGQVLVEYGKDPAGTAVNLHGGKPEDFKRGVIRSTTGELLMDTARGVCVIDAPCAQGAAGFLEEAGTIATAALTMDMLNEYGAVLAVSLDGKPLAESKKVLLQITTQSRPDGWAEEPAKDKNGNDALKILNTGGGRRNAGKPHFNVKNSRGMVAVKNPGLTKATLCDIHFYAKEDIPVRRRAGALEIKLPPNALYIVLE